MEKREIMIAAIVILVVALVASNLMNTSSAKDTQLKILNNGSIGENGTIYIKLTDMEKNSLGNKAIKVSIIDKNGKAVYSKDLKTHVTGMALVKVENITPGTYTVNVTFNGDENYTSSSASQKINISSGHVEEQLNATSDEIQAINTEISQDTTQTDSYTPVYSTDTSYTPSSSSSDQSSSDSRDDGGDDGGVIDENGNSVDTVIDENGNEVPT